MIHRRFIRDSSLLTIMGKVRVCVYDNSEEPVSNRPLTRTRTRATERLISTRRVQLALGILLIFLFLVAGYTVLEPYTGFGKRELWDWPTLGVVSAAIFLVGLLFSRRQREQQETQKTPFETSV
jgi:hypothetical protein